MCPLRVLLLCPLRVLLLWALLCPGTGNVPEEIFTRPGSDLLLPIRRHLTLNHTDTEICDRIEWIYGHPIINFYPIIFLHKGCTLMKYDDVLFSNTRLSENGSLIISNVTPEDNGIYSVIIYDSAGDHIQTDDYTVHVEVPVSVPLLHVSCLRDGSAEISCRAEEGTKPNIHLSVIGGSQERYSASANNITAIVGSPGPWNITCTVKNEVSWSEESRAGVTCPGNVPEEIFTRPGSDLLLPIRRHLTLNHTDTEICDRIEWKNKDPTRPDYTRIFIHRGCTLNKNERQFSNIRISENGSLIISNVTLRNDGIYSVIIYDSAGDHIQTDDYTVHVEVPVSVPLLHVSCPRNGSAEISCRLEEGTKPNIHLSVIGGSQERYSASANHITAIVESPGPWNITCTVKNEVSQSEESKAGVTCPDAVSVNTSLYGTAQLPCSFPFIQGPEELALVWYKEEENNKSYIYSFLKGWEYHLEQDSRYKGRTELSTELSQGDLGLTLRGVTFADVGTYYCQAANTLNKGGKKVELSIRGLNVHSQAGTLSEVDGKKRLTCITIGMFQNPWIRWYDVKNTTLTKYETHHITDEANGMKKVESVLRYDDKINETYFCQVGEGTLHTTTRIVRSDILDTSTTFP